MRVVLGCIGLAWFIAPVRTWGQFLIFASLTMLVGAVAIVYSLVEEENGKKETPE